MLFNDHRGDDRFIDSDEVKLFASRSGKSLESLGDGCIGIQPSLLTCFTHATEGEWMDRLQAENFMLCRLRQLPLKCRDHVCGSG